MILKFIWNQKESRIAIEKVFLNSKVRGLTLLDFKSSKATVKKKKKVKKKENKATVKKMVWGIPWQSSG